MIRDLTGRFTERPHYEATELEVECERLICDYLIEKHGRVVWPISTDDLTILLEQHVEKLDLYADLVEEGLDVEGVTDFFPGGRPQVRISGTLSATASSRNRLRTTLTHELGHVQFHAFLYELKAAGLDLFGSPNSTSSNAVSLPGPQKCHRETILHAKQVDWMEWQAGYACGALLMPNSHLRRVVTDYMRGHRILTELHVSAREADELVELVAGTFDVSGDAARVRLLKTKHLVETSPSAAIFDR
jgi:hypothetical protein